MARILKNGTLGIIASTILAFISKASETSASEEWRTYNGSDSDFLLTSDGTHHKVRNLCMQRGADLASIYSQDEHDFIKNLLSEPIFTREAWIALSNMTRDGFRWPDGSNPVFEAWGEGQPKEDPIGKPCVFTSRGEWINGRCTEIHAGVCKRPAGLVTPPPRTDPVTSPQYGYCPTGYVDIGSKCYRIFRLAISGRLSWDEALAKCRQEPGSRPDLASIHSSLDNAFITAQISNKTDPLWIGRKSDGTIVFWSDNSDTSFDNFRPNSHAGKCAAMAAAEPDVIGTWSQENCAKRLNYICQTHKDGSVSTPPSTSNPDCQDGYVPYSTSCYRHVATPSTWSNAATLCREQGAHLVVIHSEPENAAVQVLSAGGNVWLGLRKSASGQYEWVNGWYVLYTRWSDNEPRNGEGCVLMYTKNGTWADGTCEEKRTFICEQSSALPITTPSHMDGKCPPEGDWVPFGSYCYQFKLSERTSWYSAHEGCRREHLAATLVSIHTVVENNWLYQQVHQRTSSNILGMPDVWLGLHRSRIDNKFRWGDGSTFQFNAWALNHPGNMDCVKMAKETSIWKDDKCEDKTAGYICKIEKTPKPTTPTEGPGLCPSEEWTSYGSSCFLYKPDNIMPWQSAKVQCSKAGGYLSSVLAQHEQDHIYAAMLAHLPRHRPFWLGARRNRTSDKSTVGLSGFYWTDGTALVFAYWSKNSDDKGDCLSVNHDTGVWTKEDCTQLAGFVCRAEKVTPTDEIGRMPSVSQGMPAGAIAAIVICVFMVLALSVVVVLLLLRRQSGTTPAIRFENSQEPPLPTAIRASNDDCY